MLISASIYAPVFVPWTRECRIVLTSLDSDFTNIFGIILIYVEPLLYREKRERRTWCPFVFDQSIVNQW